MGSLAIFSSKIVSSSPNLIISSNTRLASSYNVLLMDDITSCERYPISIPLAKAITPLVGTSFPNINLINVVLPVPLFPIIATRSFS